MAKAQDDEVNAVTAAVEALRKAMVAADKPTLDELVANELSYGHSSGRLETKAEFIADTTSGKAGFSAIELSGQTVSIVDNIALVRHLFAGTSRRHGAVKLSNLMVWLKRDGEWKLVARQATKT